jgi:hypothetical protein
MARARNPHVEARARRRPRLRSASVKLAAGALAASALLVTPIVLWARFGDDHPLRTIALGVASLALCMTVVRRSTRGFVDRVLPLSAGAPAATALAASSRPGHSVVRNVPGQRDRAVRPTSPCGLSRCRPVHTSRSSRDVNCHRAAHPLELRRSVRRRTRP